MRPDAPATATLYKGNEDGKAEFEEVTDVIRWFSA
jgi:hypothetical protein